MKSMMESTLMTSPMLATSAPPDRFGLMIKVLASAKIGELQMTEANFFEPGQKVHAKSMGANPVTHEGVVKEVVGSARGSWVVVTTNDGKEVKTRPGLVSLA